MKKIFNHIGMVLSVALLGLAAACTPKEINELDAAGLSVKVFFPTKVVAGQPMTVNGTGMADVREVVFPGGVSVSNIEHVGNGMIRLTAPAGIASTGGKLVVRTSDDEAESKEDLTVGNTVVSGFSKMDGEELTGGEQLTVFGTDLEFICRAELFDTDGNPLILEDEVFYRKGTSTVILNIPEQILDGTWIGKLFTYDGKEINLPELNYKRGGGGHWETVKNVVWQNDGSVGEANWNGIYRFCLEGRDLNPAGKECVYEFPADIWERLQTETFYVTVSGANPQIRVTTGWWSKTWTGADIQPGNDLLADNGDGTWTLTVDLTSDPELVGLLYEQHLLFTGSGYAVQEIYFNEEQWVDGGGHSEIVEDIVWQNDGSVGEANWNGIYRFCLEGRDLNPAGKECVYEFPADIWERLQTETFYVTVSGANPQIRVTTGWWSKTWTGADIQPGNDLLADNGDGTWTLTVDLTSDPELVGLLYEQHLLFTGSGYAVQKIFFYKEIWVDDGGDDGPKQVVFWENPGAGGVSWNGTYRFGLEGNDGNNECIATFPEDIWNKIKSGPFYIELTPNADWFNVRVTNGWWDTSWNVGDVGANSERMIDNGDGTYHIEIDISGDADFLATVDQKHILFTGEGYTPTKLYFQ